MHRFQWRTKIRLTCMKKWSLMCWNGSPILDSPVLYQYLCKIHRWSVDIDTPISVRKQNQINLYKKIIVDMLKWIYRSGFTSVLFTPLWKPPLICWYWFTDFCEGPKLEQPVRKNYRCSVEMGQPVWIYQCPMSTCVRETVDMLILMHQFQWGTKIR